MTTQEILQGVHDWTNGKIVYDISVAHPDGQGNPTKYADLTAALGTGGANIPEPLRKGGMSVKFIQGNAQSSDNKYVQWRLTADYFTDEPQFWKEIDAYVTTNELSIYSKDGLHNFKYLGYIRKTDGGISGALDYCFTEFISVNAGDIFIIDITTAPNRYYWKIAFYDSNMQFVSGSDDTGEVTIPSGIQYIRCCGGVSDNKSIIYKYNNTKLAERILTDEENLDEVASRVSKIEEHIKSYPLGKGNLSVTDNEYVYPEGEGVLGGCCHTDFISVEAGQTWIIENCYLYVYLCNFYDENKDYVGNRNAVEGSYTDYSFEIPNGCKYMKINVRMEEFHSGQTIFYPQGHKDYAKLEKVLIDASDIDNIQSAITNVVNSDNNIEKVNNHYHNIRKLLTLNNNGGNLIAFGDSITFGYTSESSYDIGNVGKISGESLCENPYIKIVADGLGKTLINKAWSATCATQVSGRPYMYNQIIEAQSLSADVIIVAIGVNDYDVNNNNLGTLLDVVGNSPLTTSFYGEINKEFAKIKELWPNADIICITPIPYLREPHTNSLGKFVDALIEMSVIYDFSVICGEKLEFPKSLGVFSNLTLADTLHPTALGHRLMGNGILNLLIK